MPRYVFDKQAAPSKTVADAGYQTDGIERKEEYRQTDCTKGKDFETVVVLVKYVGEEFSVCW